MSDESVLHSAEQFAKFWNELLQGYPRYLLDFSWPSAGTIDLILFPHRSRAPKGPFEEKLLYGAACYLAMISARCWEKFPGGLKVELSGDEAKNEVRLSASGGTLLPAREKFSVEVVSALRSALGSREDPWFFLSGVSRPRTSVRNIVSPFALGLSTGLCPYGVGRWANISDVESIPQIMTADMIHAITAAAHYQTVNPTELIGADPNLYRNCFTYPPLGHREKSIGSRAADGLLRFIRTIEAPIENARTCALNLAYSPDETTSVVGYIVAATLIEETVPLRLALLGESLAHRAQAIRQTIDLTRTLQGEESSLLPLLAQGSILKLQKLAKIDSQLHLLPLLRIPPEEFAPKYLHALFHFLVTNEVQPAKRLMEGLAKAHTFSPALRIQLAFLQLVAGDRAAALKGVQELKSDSDYTITSSPLLAEIEAILHLHEGKQKEAKLAIERGLSSSSGDERTQTNLVNLEMEVELSASNNDLVTAIFEQHKQLSERSLRALFNLYIAQQQTGDDYQASVTLDALARYAPMDPRVFSTLVSRKQKGL